MAHLIARVEARRKLHWALHPRKLREGERSVTDALEELRLDRSRNVDDPLLVPRAQRRVELVAYELRLREHEQRLRARHELGRLHIERAERESSVRFRCVH